MVLCPGSRSGPLALAAGALANGELLKLQNSIDERSAAFFALGRSSSQGVAPAVITTSGTAVANLLPAAVEADRSCQPLLLLTADRPNRLKDCGANQTVNQEDFLRSVCRGFFSGPPEGAHFLSEEALDSLVNEAWENAHCLPGPVHINFPFEEPLHASRVQQVKIFSGWTPTSDRGDFNSFGEGNVLLSKKTSRSFPALDPSRPGLIVAGPWQGLNQNLSGFKNALSRWQSISGWPIFADPLSGVSFDQQGLIHSWELLIPFVFNLYDFQIQILRLGPMPASRNLERWLSEVDSKQVLITEGNFRNLDPLGLSSQWDGGLLQWVELIEKSNQIDFVQNQNHLFMKDFGSLDLVAQDWLDDQLPLKGPVNEPSLARWLPRLLPKGFSVMLAASSPVRDWIKFAGKGSQNRRCFGFRGASGIDGTLSLALGLCAEERIFLVTGDLALLHDTNGWLMTNAEDHFLIIFLIDNRGGGIFDQLQLETDPRSDFHLLFAMPQEVDHALIASAHSIPSREVSCLEDLNSSLDWAFAQKSNVLLRASTCRETDAVLRRNLAKGLVQFLEKIPKDSLSDL